MGETMKAMASIAVFVEQKEGYQGNQQTCNMDETPKSSPWPHFLAALDHGYVRGETMKMHQWALGSLITTWKHLFSPVSSVVYEHFMSEVSTSLRHPSRYSLGFSKCTGSDTRSVWGYPYSQQISAFWWGAVRSYEQSFPTI